MKPVIYVSEHIYNIYYAGHSSLTHSSNPYNKTNRIVYYLYFVNEKTEEQRG